MTKKTTKKSPDITFEAALERLNEVVAELESDAVSLSRSLELFTEGQQLTQLCHDQLAAAQQQVTTLIQTSEGFQERPGQVKDKGGPPT